MKNIEGKFEVKIPNMDPMMDRKIKEAIAKAIKENIPYPQCICAIHEMLILW